MNSGFSQESQRQEINYSQKQLGMRLSADDIYMIPEKDGEFGGGYHLYIRKKGAMESVLLTETTRDPNGKAANYAYRATEYNPVNGDEIRYLDEKPLVSEYAKYSLVDSSAEATDTLGQAFHIYIPPKLVYGYPWARYGEVEVGRGTFINIRTFEKKYADYTGEYMDNPFMFNLERRKRPSEDEPVVLTDDYNPVAGQKFQELSEAVIYSKGPETIIEDVRQLLEDSGSTMDLVFAIDATGSMKNDLERLKKELTPMLSSVLAAKDVRTGLLFYRDYGDNFSYKNLPVKFFGFTSDMNVFNRNLNSMRILGKEGGDIPEAVYEALYASEAFYDWRSGAQKRIILIGDAEPHPQPRGLKPYTKEMVQELAAEKDIRISAILLPNTD